MVLSTLPLDYFRMFKKKILFAMKLSFTPIYINRYKFEGLLSKITLIKRKIVE